jgi:hypothetical protein
MTSLTLGGANRFRIGSYPSGASPFTGQISRVFVYAGALTVEQVQALYNKSSQELARSPKNSADHVEAIETARLLALFDTVDSSDLIDLAVAS